MIFVAVGFDVVGLAEDGLTDDVFVDVGLVDA